VNTNKTFVNSIDVNIVFVLYCAYTNISFVSMIPHEQSVCQHFWRNSCRKQATFLGTEDAYEQFTMRTLPLVPFMRERLLTLKEEQQENRRLCGRSYIKEYLEYVCVNEIGDLIKPHYVTESFPKLLKAKGMRQIRYHDLRHPYVKHTTKNKSLQKQKSQAINAC